MEFVLNPEFAQVSAKILMCLDYGSLLACRGLNHQWKIFLEAILIAHPKLFRKNIQKIILREILVTNNTELWNQRRQLQQWNNLLEILDKGWPRYSQI